MTKIKTTFKTFHEFACDEVIVSMVQYQGRMLVATSENIYEIRDGNLARLTFAVEEFVK